MIASQIQQLISLLNRSGEGSIVINMINNNSLTFESGISVKLDKEQHCITIYFNDDIYLIPIMNVCYAHYIPKK